MKTTAIVLFLCLLGSCINETKRPRLVTEAKKFIEFQITDNDVTIDHIPDFLRVYRNHRELVAQVEKFYGKNLSSWFIAGRNETPIDETFCINIFNGTLSKFGGFIHELYKKRIYKNKSVFIKDDIVSLNFINNSQLMMKLQNTDIPSLDVILVFSFDGKGKVKSVSIPHRDFNKENPQKDSFIIYNGTTEKINYGSGVMSGDFQPDK
jgi:hypothetical protein